MMRRHGWIFRAARVGVWKVFTGAGLLGAAGAAPLSAFELIESFDSMRVLILGDSMAAGALADTSLGQELNGSQIARLQAAQTLHHRYSKTSKEYRDAMQRLSASPASHAVESAAPWSLGQHLLHDLGRDWGGKFQILNRSIIGATSDTLYEQIHTYRKDYARGGARADVVIVNVGGNDWCSEEVTPVTFAQNMEFRLYQITKDHPHALVLINGVPPVDDIFRIRDAVAFTAHGHTVMCKDFEPMLEEECPVGVRMRRAADAAFDDELRLKRQEMSRRLEEVVSRMARGGGSSRICRAHDFSRSRWIQCGTRSGGGRLFSPRKERPPALGRCHVADHTFAMNVIEPRFDFFTLRCRRHRSLVYVSCARRSLFLRRLV